MITLLLCTALCGTPEARYFGVPMSDMRTCQERVAAMPDRFSFCRQIIR